MKKLLFMILLLVMSITAIAQSAVGTWKAEVEPEDPTMTAVATFDFQRGGEGTLTMDFRIDNYKDDLHMLMTLVYRLPFRWQQNQLDVKIHFQSEKQQTQTSVRFPELEPELEQELLRLLQNELKVLCEQMESELGNDLSAQPQNLHLVRSGRDWLLQTEELIFVQVK